MNIKAVFAIGMMFLVSGCVTPIPPVDFTPPPEILEHFNVVIKPGMWGFGEWEIREFDTHDGGYRGKSYPRIVTHDDIYDPNTDSWNSKSVEPVSSVEQSFHNTKERFGTLGLAIGSLDGDMIVEPLITTCPDTLSCEWEYSWGHKPACCTHYYQLMTIKQRIPPFYGSKDGNTFLNNLMTKVYESIKPQLPTVIQKINKKKQMAEEKERKQKEAEERAAKQEEEELDSIINYLKNRINGG